MKKKILLSVCFILIGCFLGTTIGELKYRNMNEKKSIRKKSYWNMEINFR